MMKRRVSIVSPAAISYRPLHPSEMPPRDVCEAINLPPIPVRRRSLRKPSLNPSHDPFDAHHATSSLAICFLLSLADASSASTASPPTHFTGRPTDRPTDTHTHTHTQNASLIVCVTVSLTQPILGGPHRPARHERWIYSVDGKTTTRRGHSHGRELLSISWICWLAGNGCITQSKKAIPVAFHFRGRNPFPICYFFPSFLAVHNTALNQWYFHVFVRDDGH